MEISLTWEVVPDLVIKTIELKGEFKQGEQYAISKGFKLQRGLNATILEEEYGRSNFVFYQKKLETD